MSYEVKDSGERHQFESGMVRDVTTGKTAFTLVFDGPMLERWAEHLTKGAAKYAKRNWMKAKGPEELDRFVESATRHFIQWLRGDVDEDHASAVFFNINGAEYVKQKMCVEVGASIDEIVKNAVMPISGFTCPQDGQENCCPHNLKGQAECVELAKNRDAR